ncbi:hypothetical protein OGAPHI_004533 [Ogataea philodendri]|uniref:Lactam utilization protein lamB n=1 Tax=Ogataea philodendri TaxID=1378263 RepID=A0A9P8P7Y8_9ASCO|nr:uncharacterized protein OGAPHI_004533 [Ogataea philodendri]KAH3666344.1 hypothetical protein OGAPHI_004533 [Ogataea philodendri]
MATIPGALAGSAKLNEKYMDKYEIVCDMGEGFGKWKMGPDEKIMPLIDVANIACGFHAGDYNIMANMVKLAKKYNVKVGSHPGLPDLLGFGRRRFAIPPDEIFNLVMYQTGALKAFLDAEGLPLNHIKPHGELYFYVERDEEVMRAVLRAAQIFKVPVIGAKNAHYEKVAKEMGVDFIQELYLDIDWTEEGKLVPPAQSRPKNPTIIYNDLVEVAETDELTSVSGSKIKFNFGTTPFMLCLHSDMPTALENISKAREATDAVNAKRGYPVKKKY